MSRQTNHLLETCTACRHFYLLISMCAFFSGLLIWIRWLHLNCHRANRLLDYRAVFFRRISNSRTKAHRPISVHCFHFAITWWNTVCCYSCICIWLICFCYYFFFSSLYRSLTHDTPYLCVYRVVVYWPAWPHQQYASTWWKTSKTWNLLILQFSFFFVSAWCF